MLKKILSSTIIKLVLAVIAGILLGFVVGEGFMNVVVTLKYILGQLIFFMVPLIILAFISSSIASSLSFNSLLKNMLSSLTLST